MNGPPDVDSIAASSRVGPPDLDRIAELATPQAIRDTAGPRRAAFEARHRRAEVRELLEAAQDRAAALAGGLADGRVTEAEVLDALRARDELRLRLEVWSLAVRDVDTDPALVDRR